jgi:putative flippase GtrA
MIPWWHLLGRHQLAALTATAVDFSTMIAMVDGAGLSPVAGTALGAGLGAITNFTLGRYWTFEAGHRPPIGQVLRYAFVSGMSLGLNALGEYLMNVVLHVQYVVARMMVAALVSWLWNFPMQRHFVFRH